MKRLLWTLVMVPVLALAEGKSSTPSGFTDDLDAALASAKTSGKLVYACFSGSDWCGWCQRLEQEVLSKAEFQDAVKDAYELVYIDSPSDKSLLSERARKENPKLTKKFGIRGFPTALILDGEGRKVAETGYRRGGPEKYAKYLKALKKNGAEIARLNAEIAKLQAQVHALENEE